MIKKTILPIAIFFILILSIGLFTNKEITKYDNFVISQLKYDELTAERQELYDKMKIEYVSVKNRITGTEPFNEETASNADGVDISATDDYVRTLDVMKYTIEVGVIPNTDHEGVTSSDIYIGGVLKVRAKLPNQGSDVLMTWDKDAWMQNVQYNSDKTEIYAEYHVPDGVSITNGNQNLTFTVKVGGIKKTVTSAMAPEFEVWMEGNYPDDNTSLAQAETIKDNHNTIISGKYSFDFMIKAGELNNYEKRNNVEGHYVNYIVIGFIYQPYSYINDFRGVLLPNEKITITLEGDYRYHYPDEVTGWQLLTNESNLLNGTSVIDASTNCVESSGFYPSEIRKVVNAPGGIRSCGSSGNSVFNGGDFHNTLSNNIFQLTFENYAFDSVYPTVQLNAGAISDAVHRGAFVVGNTELFVPYYNPSNKSDFEDQIRMSIKTMKLGTNTYTNGVSDAYQDGVSNDTVSISIIKRNGGLYSPIRSRKKDNSAHLSSKYYSEDAAIILDDYFIMESWNRATTGPYEGGVDNTIAWNNNFFELVPYELPQCNDPDGIYYFTSTSELGFEIPSKENYRVYYGIYKTNPTNGITTNTAVNAAKYENFDWYSTYNEAKTHGKIAGIYINDPDYRGNAIYRYSRFRFHALKNAQNIGEVGTFRMRAKYYGDQERTDVYYFRGEDVYNSDTAYIPSEYDASGTIITRGAPEELGESIIVIGLKTSVELKVTDLDSNNQLKKAYDVQENEINFKITPTLSNGKSPSDSDEYYEDVKVKAILPVGLSYKNNSASKTPTSVVQNADGTTTITWIYNHWQVNHDPESDKTITFTSNISASLENNTSINVMATIEHPDDVRDLEAYRESNYGIVISNLAGSRSSKAIDKPVLEPNESFVVTSTLGNNNEEALNNVRSIEILPRPNDENGSNYHGDYTIKVSSLATNQKMYYATGDINSIGISQDRYGKNTIIDTGSFSLETDTRWTEVAVGDTIPANATAIATIIPSIAAKSEINYSFQVIPSNNQKKDTYAFALNMTSNNLEVAVRSNIVTATVVERKISGIVFTDNNNDNLYTNADQLLNNMTVELLDSSQNKIQETTTNNRGYYEFSLDEPGTYYVKFTSKDGYELITKGTANNASKANDNLITDSINHTAASSTPIAMIGNINLGIRKKQANLNIKYIDKDTNLPIIPEENKTIYYTDTYEVTESDDIPNAYRYVESTGDPLTGVVNKDSYVVTRFYELKPANVITHYYIDGSSPLEKLAEDHTQEKKYTQEYSTTGLDTTNSDYELSRTDGDSINGIVSKDEYNVNYYYKLKKGTVTTHHYLYENGVETTTKLAEDDVKTYNYRDIYTTEESTDIPKNYELYRRTTNYTGEVKTPSTEVIYYYQLKDSNLVTTIDKVSDQEITDKNTKIKSKITYHATIGDYIGDATITIVDTLPYKINLQESNIDNGIYNDDNQTITWTETITGLNTYNETNLKSIINIEKNIEVLYIGVTGRDRVLVNSVRGEISLTNNNRSIEDQSSTSVKILGEITTKYVDIDTNVDLINPIKTTDLVGEKYDEDPKEIDGFEIVETPPFPDYEEEPQTIVYKLRRRKVKIKTIVKGEGGSISGDEIIYWGEDSTDENIIINIDNGYEIDKILINGIEQDIEGKDARVVLSRFLKLKEDKLIEVSFKKHNPNTSANISIIIFIGLLISSIILLVTKKLIPNRYKVNN